MNCKIICATLLLWGKIIKSFVILVKSLQARPFWSVVLVYLHAFLSSIIDILGSCWRSSTMVSLVIIIHGLSGTFSRFGQQMYVLLVDLQSPSIRKFRHPFRMDDSYYSSRVFRVLYRPISWEVFWANYGVPDLRFLEYFILICIHVHWKNVIIILQIWFTDPVRW